MSKFSRRKFISYITSSSIAFFASSIYANTLLKNKNDISKENIDKLNSHDFKIKNDLNQLSTDDGTLPNLRFSFSDTHIRKTTGGWTRQITRRELGIATTIAGVNMRLYSGGIRELHWHKEGEWAYMLYGKARITAIDTSGGYFIDDVSKGDLWFFPPGIPHSIQGLEPNGCEFLLVFDNGDFDEDSTFLLSDWFNHIPKKILSKNFNVSSDIFKKIPSPKEKYIFSGIPPGKIGDDFIINNKKSKYKFSHCMISQKPLTMKGGSVFITDSTIFPVSLNISAALVELLPGAIRELHWHTNNDEWQYYIEGKGKTGVFASSGKSQTFNFYAGDVGYIPFAMGHYIENIGNKPLKFLEIFKSSHYADISLNQWLASTPYELINQHLHFNQKFLQSLNIKKQPIIF